MTLVAILRTVILRFLQVFDPLHQLPQLSLGLLKTLMKVTVAVVHVVRLFVCKLCDLAL